MCPSGVRLAVWIQDRPFVLPLLLTAPFLERRKRAKACEAGHHERHQLHVSLALIRVFLLIDPIIQTSAVPCNLDGVELHSHGFGAMSVLVSV